jgi:S-DNA-T family DNA segregation ATPase FtsK/SpoIIIE
MGLRTKGNRSAAAAAIEGGTGISPRKREIIGLLALCAGVVALLSLFSHSTADGWGFGNKGATYNLIGPVGAALSYLLLKLMGIASFVIAAGLLAIGVASIRHQEIRVQVLETIGWILLTVSSAAFLQGVLGGRKVLGAEPGGYMGLYAARGMIALFGGVGSLVVLGALILLSLVIATNLSIRTVALFSAGAASAVAKFLYRTGDAALTKILPPEQEGEWDDADAPVVVLPDKPARKPRKSAEKSEQALEDGEKAEEPAPSTGKKERAKEREVPAPAAEVADLAAEREKRKKEKAEPEPEISIVAMARPKKKPKTGPVDDRPLYDPSKGFSLPSSSLVTSGDHKERALDENSLRDNAKLLEQNLRNYGVEGKVQSIRPGPVITMYEFKPAPGIKVSKITTLQNDLAMALSAIKVRIVAPIPGRDVVGIEVPNKDREKVFMRECVESEAFNNPKYKLGLAIGKDIEGTPVSVDLAKMPHLLVAGATGAGKSVSVNSMIMSLLFKHSPEEVKFILVDPKMVELKVYEGIPHLLLPVVTDPKKAALALRWAVDEMNRRYQKLADLAVREIDFYNKKVDRILKGEEQMPESLKVKMEEARQAALTGIGPDGKEAPEAEPIELKKLPYIVIVVDEFADLMMVAARDVETSVARLAQMARAVGLHIILATQRPSTDVISGVIKANFPARVSFQVASQIDSRTILDTGGAENLVGMGDMLLMGPGSSSLQRIHGAFVNENDIKAVVDFLKAQGKPVYNEEILKPRPGDGGDGGEDGEDADGYDEFYDQAVEIVCRERRASISYLQRKLQVGYNRAARMIERMETEGVLGPPDSKGQREVLAPPV